MPPVLPTPSANPMPVERQGVGMPALSSNVTPAVPRRTHGMEATVTWGASLATSRDMNGCTDSLARLMARYAAGEDGIFDAIYQGLEAPLYRFCLRLAARRH